MKAARTNQSWSASLHLVLLLVLLPAGFLAFGCRYASAAETCGNAFVWDEIKSRTLCNIGNGPASCLALNSLSAAVLGGAGYKVGAAGANLVEGQKAVKAFADATKLVSRLHGTAQVKIAAEARFDSDDKLTPVEKEKLNELMDRMRNRGTNTFKQLEALNNPYSSRTFKVPGGTINEVAIPETAQGTARANAVFFERLYLDYRDTYLQLVETKTNLKHDVNQDSGAPYTKEEKAAFRKHIAELTKEMKAQRAEAMKAYRGLYKGTATALARKSGRVGGGFAFAAAVPLAELAKEPAKRMLCGFQSTATGEAMADIGAVAVLSKDGCRIDIPDDKLFELALRDEEELHSLPKPICTMVMAKLDNLRNQQENSRPSMTADPTCRADGFTVPIMINGREYIHEYKRKNDAIELTSSFLPTTPPGQSSILKNLPGGAERFSFRVALLDSDPRWSKVSTALPQWNAFATGDALANKGQGLPEAILFSQSVGSSMSPPTPAEARAALQSSGMTLNYIASIGEQIRAANNYLPGALEFCSVTGAARTDMGSKRGLQPLDVKK